MTTPRLLVLLCFATLLSACTSARVVRSYYPDDPPPSRTTSSVRETPPRAPVQPIPRGETYVVKAGDTLYGIATRFGLNYHTVAEWNGLAEPYAIQVGQPLVLAEPPELPSPPDVGDTPVVSKPIVSTPPASKPVTAAPTPFETVPPVVTKPVSTPTPPTTAPVVSKPVVPIVPVVVPVPTPSIPVPPPVVAPPVAPVVAPVIDKPLPPIAGAPSWRWPTQGEGIGRYVSGDQTQQGINIAGKAGQTVTAAADGVVVYSGAGLVGYGELIIVKHSDEWLSAYAHNRRRLVAEGTKVKSGEAIAEMGRTGAIRDMLHFEIRRNGKPVDPLLFLPKQ